MDYVSQQETISLSIKRIDLKIMDWDWHFTSNTWNTWFCCSSCCLLSIFQPSSSFSWTEIATQKLDLAISWRISYSKRPSVISVEVGWLFLDFDIEIFRLEEEVCGKASYIQGDTTTQRLYFECPENMRIVDFFGFSLRNVSTCSIVRILWE